MIQEVVTLSPDALGYKDRGKMKWLGLMLSDHSEALKKQKQTTYSLLISPKPQQSMEEISACLYRSYAREKPLAIQLDVIKEGYYLPDIEGFIIGFKENSIYLKQRDQTLKRIALEDIRHIDWIDTTDWFAKYTRQDVTI
ncbi:hypothetical protein ACO1PF_04320 [Alkalibacterium sp. f15]|uniref:hypothetical protein n=1 Tax=Alkalibacterium sp. f15 TaxID=3414029 RepID=UPI003BF86462